MKLRTFAKGALLMAGALVAPVVYWWQDRKQLRRINHNRRLFGLPPLASMEEYHYWGWLERMRQRERDGHP